MGGQEGTVGAEFKRRMLNEVFGGRRPLSSMGSFLKAQSRATTALREGATTPIGNAPDITLPALVKPKIERPKPNADVGTLVSQMDALLRVAQSIGALSITQQNLVIRQIKQAKAVNKEAQMEAGTGEKQAQLVENDDLSVDLTPLDDVMGKLSKTIYDLIDTIEEKIKTKCDCKSIGVTPVAGRGGVGNVRVPAPVALLSGPTTGQIQAPKGSFVRDPNDRRQSLLKRVQRRMGGQERTRRAEFKRRLKGEFLGSKPQLSTTSDYMRGQKPTQASAEVAGLIGTGVKKKATSPLQAINETAIKRIVGPMIKKALGSTALKSIPLVGAGVGAAMAAGRLLEGDIVGAGLDVASGLGGPLTAIPALAATLARDAYAGLFGIPPEQDPGFGPKLGMITGIVGGLIKTALASKVKPMQPAAATTQTSLIPVKTKPVGKTAPTASLTSTPVSRPTTSPRSTGGGGAAVTAPSTGGGGGRMLGDVAPTPAPASSPPPSAPPTAEPSKPKDVEAISPAAKAPMAATVTEGIFKGPDIAVTSILNDMLSRIPVIDPTSLTATTVIAKPATNITTKNGARGMGNVPDPNYYDVGDIVSQLYFTAAS